MTPRVVLTIVLAIAAPAFADAPRVRVGATGTLTVDSSVALIATPVTDDADLIVRISAVAERGVYRIEYTPTRAGTFDVRDYLRAVDGRAAPIIGPLNVDAFYALPAGDMLDAVAVPPAPPLRLGGYKIVATVAVAIWALCLMPLLFWRRPRRVVVREAGPIIRALTNDERLDALIQQLRHRTATIEQKVALESLLFDSWRRHIGANGLPITPAQRAIHENADVSAAADDLEHRLHAPGGGVDDLEPVLSAAEGRVRA